MSQVTITAMRKALSTAGYNSEPTPENVQECFLDYVDCGQWSNLDYDIAVSMINNAEITLNDMTRALINL